MLLRNNALAGHFLGDGQTDIGQHRRGDVRQAAALAQLHVAAANGHKGHHVGGVGGEGSAIRVLQLFGVAVVGGQEGADPASVVYDAVAAAKARRADVLLCDTAGRLHNKKNLMEELRKIYRILEREYPEAYLETLVVLDGTTGQNALSQARQFAEVANVTGIILTKLDGTAKGGIAVAIQSELDIPVKYIGVGESIDDLQKFDADAFVNALFDVEERS